MTTPMRAKVQVGSGPKSKKVVPGITLIRRSWMGLEYEDPIQAPSDSRVKAIRHIMKRTADERLSED